MQVTNKRIEHVDAIRGFAMLLVVMGHVVDGTFQGIRGFSWTYVAFLFHVPLFFFISGFVSYKPDIIWTWGYMREFVKKKFMLLIIPTIVFLSLYAYIHELSIESVIDHRWKAGYWFTYTLFFYFLLFALLSTITHKIHISEKWKMSILILLGLCLTLAESRTMDLFVERHPFLMILSLQQLHFFIFFALGIVMKKNVKLFYSWFDNSYLMAFLIIAFCVLYLFFHHIQFAITGIIFKFITFGILGIFIIFAFFKKYESVFKSTTVLGNCLQYIGKNTLDVYLLHFFFISNTWNIIGDFFSTNPNPPIELFFTLIVTCWICSLSLLTSCVIRLSPFLACYLLGKPKKK